MTLRNPLVIVPGGTPIIQELPAGDTVAGSTPGINGTDGTNGTNGTNGLNGAMSLFSTQVASGSPATLTFSTIPGTSGNIMIILNGRDTAAGSSDLSVRMKINGDTTAANYTSTQYLLGQAAAASANNQASTAAGSICAEIPGTSGNANAVGSARIIIPNYSGTTFHKQVIEDSYELHSAGPSLLRIQRAFTWKSTSAITDIVLTAGGTAFVNGTTAWCYLF